MWLGDGPPETRFPDHAVIPDRDVMRAIAALRKVLRRRQGDD